MTIRVVVYGRGNNSMDESTSVRHKVGWMDGDTYDSIWAIGKTWWYPGQLLAPVIYQPCK